MVLKGENPVQHFLSYKNKIGLSLFFEGANKIPTNVAPSIMMKDEMCT